MVHVGGISPSLGGALPKSQFSSGSCLGDGVTSGLEQGLPGYLRAALSTFATSSNRNRETNERNFLYRSYGNAASSSTSSPIPCQI
ncbi:hypothetical protein CAJAP_08860 [Camponotus japonicus]